MENGTAPKKITLSDAAEQRMQKLISLYPQRKSAVMPALYIAQEELGWLTNDAISWVASSIGVSEAHVRAVATFYTMYYKRPVGKYHIQVCRTLSCMLCGAKEITAYVAQRFGIKPGETTKDGMWSYEEVECLGSCGTAPLVQINDVFFESLSSEKLGQIIQRIEHEKPDLRYSTVKGELGQGMPDQPRSVVWKGSS